jgi:phosphomannomutase
LGKAFESTNSKVDFALKGRESGIIVNISKGSAVSSGTPPNTAKFGTSGLRGLATELVGETTRRYVLAFVQLLLKNGKTKVGQQIYVGRDFRLSSPLIVQDVLAAVRSAGLVPVTCGALPTPALVYFANAHGAACIMVTGSHIPGDRNGIKFYNPEGEITKADEHDIVQRVTQVVDPGVSANVLAETVDAHEAANEFFVQRCHVICPPLSLSGLRVGVYQHSTVARDLLVALLTAAGAHAAALARSDVFIPVDTEAVSTNTQTLLHGWAGLGGFDAIVSADGDGDRPLVADEFGNIVRGDVLGIVTSEFLGAETVVTPLTSNSGIATALKCDNPRTRVGSPFVIAAMEKAHVDGQANIVGFEANGGFLTFSPFQLAQGALAPLPTRDCFLPILALLRAVQKKGMSVSELVQSYRLPITKADRLENFPVDVAATLLNHLRESASHLSTFLASIGSVIATDNLDGLRVSLAGGQIVHFRASGNAPEFRCYVEADTEQEADLLLKTCLARVRNFAENV